MKPRIKLKLLPDAPAEGGVADGMAKFAEGAGMLVLRQLFGYELAEGADGSRWPRALTPLCYTSYRAVLPVMEARSRGVVAGVAEVVEWFDPDEPDSALVYQGHCMLAEQELEEWQPKFRDFLGAKP